MRLVLMLWLLCHTASVDSQQQSTPKTNPHQAQPNTDQRGTQDSPFVVKVLETEGTKQQAARDAQDRQVRAEGEKTITRLNRYLVLIGIVQSLIFFMQFLMMLQAGRTTKRQLRAYVSVKSAAIHDVAPGRTPGVEVILENFGQTPAFRFQASRVGCRVVDLPVPSDGWDIKTDERRNEGRNFALGSGAEFTLHTTLQRPFTAEEIDALGRGQKLMFAIGEVRYLDAFRTKRTTKYRFIYGGTYGHSQAGSLAMAEEGNDQD